jgi:hypothetical protein
VAEAGALLAFPELLAAVWPQAVTPKSEIAIKINKDFFIGVLLVS